MGKYIFFDIDDTLLETFKNSYTIFNTIAKEYEFSIMETDFLELYKQGDFKKNITHFFGYYDFDTINQRYEELKQQFPKQKYIDEEFVFFLHKKGYKIGILTNGPEVKTWKKLSYLGLQKENFFLVLHGENMKTKKPDPKVFDGVYERIGNDYEKIVYVGDSLDDYKATIGRPIIFYGVLTGIGTKEEFLQEGVKETHLFLSLKNLLPQLP